MPSSRWIGAAVHGSLGRRPGPRHPRHGVGDRAPGLLAADEREAGADAGEQHVVADDQPAGRERAAGDDLDLGVATGDAHHRRRERTDDLDVHVARHHPVVGTEARRHEHPERVVGEHAQRADRQRALVVEQRRQAILDDHAARPPRLVDAERAGRRLVGRDLEVHRSHDLANLGKGRGQRQEWSGRGAAARRRDRPHGSGRQLQGLE